MRFTNVCVSLHYIYLKDVSLDVRCCVEEGENVGFLCFFQFFETFSLDRIQFAVSLLLLAESGSFLACILIYPAFSTGIG